MDGASAIERLKRRQDFLAAARARSFAANGVVVQMRRRGDEAPPRVGFTTTRKLGSAVVRNRIKRRLKEAVRLALKDRLKPGRDYVFIGRARGLERPFEALSADLLKAIDRLEREPAAAGQRT